MTSIAEFSLQPADFPLGAVFEDRPATRLDLDRVVPSGDTVMPYFWVYDPDRDLAGVQRVFAGLPELRSAVLMDDLGERGLFRAEWHPDHLGIMSAIAETGVTVVSATGDSGGWTFELRAETTEQFSAFQRYCSDHDVDVALRRLRQLSETTAEEYGLTPEQRTALVLAYTEGYYRTPAATDQASLAARLDISRQALSARLRRGYHNLIGNTLVRDPPDEGA